MLLQLSLQVDKSSIWKLPLSLLMLLQLRLQVDKSLIWKLPLSLQVYHLFQHVVFLIQHLVLLQRVEFTWNHIKYKWNVHVIQKDLHVEACNDYFSVCNILANKYSYQWTIQISCVYVTKFLYITILTTIYILLNVDKTVEYIQ